MYQDYADRGVNFYYVYKSLAHPEVNNYVAPVNISEKLMHIAEFRRLTNSQVPWICDTMDREVAIAFGNAPNSEFILDEDGKVVRKRFWSNPNTLRQDLEELVGAVENPTAPDETGVQFSSTVRKVASGVVPRLELPKGLVGVRVTAQPKDDTPYYVKLRVEMSSSLKTESEGQLYLGLYLDPIYKVHWNNRAGSIQIKLTGPEGVSLEPAVLKGPKVEADADVDPRMFLVDVEHAEPGTELSIEVQYVACDDAETFCLPVTQHYLVKLEYFKPAGTRPGIFMDELFGKVADFDQNRDGNVTVDELPKGKVTMYMGHLDRNLDNVIDQSEIADFMAMFNNGRGIEKPVDDSSATKND